MVLGDKTSTLDLRHELKHTDNQTNNSETTNASVDGFVEAAHEKKVFDDSHKNGHGWVLIFPADERVNGINTSKILKRNINLQAGRLVDVFDQRNSSMGDNLDRLSVSYTLRDKEFLELVQPTFSSKVSRRAAVHIAGRANDQIHISGRKIQARHEGAKGMNLRAGKISTIAAHCQFEIVHQSVADALLELTRPDIIVKINDFLVQAMSQLATCNQTHVLLT